MPPTSQDSGVTHLILRSSSTRPRGTTHPDLERWSRSWSSQSQRAQPTAVLSVIDSRIRSGLGHGQRCGKPLSHVPREILAGRPGPWQGTGGPEELLGLTRSAGTKA